MKFAVSLCLASLMLPAARPAAAGGPAPDSTAIVADTTLSFGLEIGSRLYPEWKEEQTVKLQDGFYLADTDLTARLVAFVPDFRIIDKKVRSVSPRMGNPAAFVIVESDSGAVDSTWAFLNFPPHFSPKSFFTFRLREVTGYVEPVDTRAAPVADEKEK